MHCRQIRLLSSAAVLLSVSTLFAQGAKAAPPAAPAPVAHVQNASLRSRLTSTTALTVASSVADARSAVTLMATVDGPVSAAPGGSVVFTAAGREIGEVPLTHGSASLTVTDLPNGPSTLTATYKGDSNLLPSKSATIRFYNDEQD